jgi:simple sugar transport system permease protein
MMMDAFGSLYGLSDSLLQAIPLMACALGVSVAFRMSLNNIGGEGQFVMGALFAMGTALYIPGIPDFLMIPAVFTVAFIGGGLWAILAITPKALWGINETIVTLMFNYIAALAVEFLVFGPWKDSTGSNLAMSKKIPESALLPSLFGTRIHVGILIVLLAAVLLYVFFSHTVWGYQIRVIGSNEKAARFSGMQVEKTMFLVMLISGGLAGVAGFMQVAGTVQRLQPNIANGMGFTGIIIAYLSKMNPFTIIFVSFLFGALSVGQYTLQFMGMPSQFVLLLEGVILMFVLSGEILINYRIILRKKDTHVHVKEIESA